MGEETRIPWCDHTFNPWWGCSPVSSGCERCYAATFANRYGYDVFGVGKPRRTFNAHHWGEPRTWNKHAAEAGRRDRVFCGSMCDVFEEPVKGMLEEERTRLWRLIIETPALDWLLLTKRPENIRRLMPATGFPKNVWTGTTVENQHVLAPRLAALAAVDADCLKRTPIEELGEAMRALRARERELEQLRQLGAEAEGLVVEARVRVEELQARIAEAAAKEASRA